jgi:aspartyl-tRNA(Asn)/glutamyl-tRNA(Gln) amidotransferase subunit C
MITVKDIEKLAELARISVNDAEKNSLVKEIDSILAYVAEVNEAGKIPQERKMSPVRNVLRPDENPHEPGLYTEKILREAPQRLENYLKVKKIIAQD